MPHTILFPIETLARELDIRIVWATYLAKHGITSLFGDRRIIHTLSKNMQNGTYVGKQAFMAAKGGRYKIYNRLVKNSFTRIYMEEEGAVFFGDEGDWINELSARSDLPSLQKKDHIFTWGDHWKTYYLTNLDADQQVNVQTFGHPRFDIYRPPLSQIFARSVESITSKYGRFVLVNTNVGFANNGAGIEDTFSKRFGFYSDEKTRLNATANWAATVATMAHIVELVHNIAVPLAKQGLNILVRPHPSEGMEFYNAAFRMLDNVKVVREGSPTPWILASEAMIHDGCTTAIEADIGGILPISFRPVTQNELKLPLPNSLGIIAKTSKEVLAAIENRDQAQSMPKRLASNTPAEMLLENLSGPTNLAFLNQLVALTRDNPATVNSPSNRKIAFLTKSKEWEESIKLSTPYLRPSKKQDIEYQRGKFPGINRSEALRIFDIAKGIYESESKIHFFGRSMIKIEP